MPVITIYPEYFGGYVQYNSLGETYYAAMQGAGLTSQNNPPAGIIGQSVSGYQFQCRQLSWQFLLAPLSNDLLIGAEFNADSTSDPDQDFTIEVRSQSGIGWINGESLGAYTLCASAPTSTMVWTAEAALLAMLETAEDRDALGGQLFLNASSSRQRTATAPTSGVSEWVTVYGYGGALVCTTEGNYSLTTTAQVGLSTSYAAELMGAEDQVSTRAVCRLRPHTRATLSPVVRAYDFNRDFMGILPGRVALGQKLDGFDQVSMDIPWRYGKIDGTTDDRTSMITAGWYLEHEGHWYRTADFSKRVYGNVLPVVAHSAEIDLDTFQTNYGQVPFSMRSHTPSEIMDAAFGGQPECDWYNGDFALLDETEFPLGWTPDVAASWAVYNPDGEATMATDATSATLQSEGIRHTVGAEIKPLVDVYVDSDFAGQVGVVCSWQNSVGTETHSDTLTVTTIGGEWVTFEAPDWLKVRNERCKLTLSVANNAEEATVRFRRVRFKQNETDSGWKYYGSMDARVADVPYTDPLWAKYGAWSTAVEEQMVGNLSWTSVYGGIGWVAKANDKRYCAKVTFTEAATVSEAWTMLWEASGTANCRLAVYDSDLDLVAESDEITIDETVSIQVFPFTGGLSVDAGDYWFCIHTSADVASYMIGQYTSGGPDYYEVADTYSDGAASTAGFVGDPTPTYMMMRVYCTPLAASALWSSTAGDMLGRAFTGDLVTVNFGAGGAGARADVLVDGIVRVSGFDVSVPCTFTVGELNRYRPHTLEIVVSAGTVSVTGITLSTENRIAVNWNKLGLYQAALALKDIVGGEFYWDTRDRILYHDLTQGENLTTLGMVWFREGVNLGDFEPTESWDELGNRGYGAGYGDGAFQIGVVIDADEVDEDGYTSVQKFGVLRFPYTNKEAKDVHTLAMETLTEANRRAHPPKTYSSTVPDEYAAYLRPGDTCRVTHSVLGGTKELRVLQIDRVSGDDSATVLWGKRITVTDAASQYGALKRKVDQLLRV